MADGKFMMGRRSFVSGSIAATALAALAGCGKKSGSSDSKGGGAKTGGTLKYFISEPVCIDPYNCQESEGSAVSESNNEISTALHTTGKLTRLCQWHASLTKLVTTVLSTPSTW